MRVSTLYHSIPVLTVAFTPSINAAANSESDDVTAGNVLSTSEHKAYRMNGPGQLAMIYTEPMCPRRLGAQNLYAPGDDTDALQIEHCSAVCINLPEGVRGESIELSLSGPLILGERPNRPYARLYETPDCRGVGTEASIRKMQNWSCTEVEDEFWGPGREGGFGSFMVWEGCRYLETEEQREETQRNMKLKKERVKAKAAMEQTIRKANDKERKIQKEERKSDKKLEKQIEKERAKQWEREQKEKKKQDKQEAKEQQRKDKQREKDRKAAWAAWKKQRKQDMKEQFEEWRQDRILELEEEGENEREERRAQRQREREERQAELLEMERQWEQNRRDRVIEDDREWEELLANEAMERARDEEEEEMLEAEEERQWAKKYMKRDARGGPLYRLPTVTEGEEGGSVLTASASPETDN
ncbi:hypothetical protein O988_08012 [Pseudogymnoascus sp. VKM F-3808]|nr:hypothetical protein O988_08012 [Pseudogymnoascus sp. VKM F-3808]